MEKAWLPSRSTSGKLPPSAGALQHLLLLDQGLSSIRTSDISCPQLMPIPERNFSIPVKRTRGTDCFPLVFLASAALWFGGFVFLNAPKPNLFAKR